MEPNIRRVESDEFPVPQGYTSWRAYARFTNFEYDGSVKNACIELCIEKQAFKLDTSNSTLEWDVDQLNSPGPTAVPILLIAYGINSYTCAIEITFIRRNSFYQKWQLRTYEKILQAYQRQKSEYEERLANLQAAIRVGALGKNKEEKRSLMHNELKKNCISIFTYQFFDVFNGIDLINENDPITGDTITYAQIRLPDAEAQGKYIRFFEEAFEWDQIMYNLYPYFWGRKNHWMDNVTFEDQDPEFAEFLRAGASRVVIPVRPGFEKMFIHFMETGEIWNGGELPDINSPLYVPLLQEIKEQEHVQGEEKPYGLPWKIKLPTTLVFLRENNELPTWSLQNGEWVSS
ncbi:hypothetical protein A9498_10055 [Bacillus thuringiensis serovar coreanensis]|nr:hypothetical protein A9498_10055 [Bacillus thuringiensis serovar coreanensis]